MRTIRQFDARFLRLPGTAGGCGGPAGAGVDANAQNNNDHWEPPTGCSGARANQAAIAVVHGTAIANVNAKDMNGKNAVVVH